MCPFSTRSQVRQVSTHGRGTAKQSHMPEEEIGPVEFNTVRDPDATDRSARTRGGSRPCLAGVGLPRSSDSRMISSSKSRMISRTRWAQSARNDRKPGCRYKTNTADPPASEGLQRAPTQALNARVRIFPASVLRTPPRGVSKLQFRLPLISGNRHSPALSCRCIHTLEATARYVSVAESDISQAGQGKH
jgi:hypothetical protein